MKETKYTVKYTTSFKKDYKRAIKRGLKIELLEEVVAMLAMGEPLPDIRTATMTCPAIGQVIGNVIFSRTGCLSTALRMMFWC